MTIQDQAKGLSNTMLNKLICEDWMARELVTAGPLDSVGRARELLQEHRINQLPIIKDDKLVGIATDRDLRTKEYIPQSSYEIPLELVMSRDVITVEPHRALIDAVLVLRRKRIGSVPIVNNGRLVGILKRSDILEAFISEEKGWSGKHASA
jgi:CBS domain-containing protein